jgi:hypothetical protein
MVLGTTEGEGVCQTQTASPYLLGLWFLGLKVRLGFCLSNKIHVLFLLASGLHWSLPGTQALLWALRASAGCL